MFTPLWFAKHQEHVPALFIAFFEISATGVSSQDEQIKADINAIKTSLNRSGFKTRFASVLISDGSVTLAPGLEERLASIRRATSLDSTNGLFFVPPMSVQTEVAAFVQNLMSTLQPLCVDYYRDLTKHARRKKARVGSSPSVTSPVDADVPSLSTSGWNVRYEVKQGIFAEFRQEMDVADRHYSAAIDELLSAEGVLELTPTTSARWEEARALCDCLALRVLRCQLWTLSTTGAAQSWTHYKSRVHELVDTREERSSVVNLAAWDAQWAEIMAQLVQRAEVPAFRAPPTQTDESDEKFIQSLYAMPEKSFATVERLPPSRFLHHPGYWLRLAFQYLQGLSRPRRENETKDHLDEMSQEAMHDSIKTTEDLARLASSATEEYRTRHQARMIEVMHMSLAHEYLGVERFESAVQVLKPMWEQSTWRDDHWHNLFADMLALLQESAIHQKDSLTVLGTTYEMLSVQSQMPPGVALKLEQCLDRVQSSSGKIISLNYMDGERLCPVSVSFAFAKKETHVGDSIDCQLVLTSRMNLQAEPLTLSSTRLAFGKSLKLDIDNDIDAASDIQEVVDLTGVAQNDDRSLNAKANLTLQSNTRRVFNFRLTFREPEIIRLQEATIIIKSEKFAIEHTLTNGAPLSGDAIFVQSEETVERKTLPHWDATAISVLPKPPKAQISLQGLRKQYYTDEQIALSVRLLNGEPESIGGKITARLEDDANGDILLQWQTEQNSTEASRNNGPHSSEVLVHNIEPTAEHETYLLIKAPAEALKTTLTLQASYTVSSDPISTLQKTTTIELDFVVPFESKFSFGPLLCTDPWPSYFNAEQESGKPAGIRQRWRLDGQVRSLTPEDIMLNEVELIIDDIVGDSDASVIDSDHERKETLKSDQSIRYSFGIRTQKQSLDDRRPTVLEPTLAITWSRSEQDKSVTTHLIVPRLTLPVSEPRVLCTLDTDSPLETDAVLQYHIENPSTHFLTFALTMEWSEAFAFSGPKYRTLSLAPLSRQRVEFRICLHSVDELESSTEDGQWIWPSLQVIDSYYQKNLRVHPGGVDVQLDDKQNICAWIEAR